MDLKREICIDLIQYASLSPVRLSFSYTIAHSLDPFPPELSRCNQGRDGYVIKGSRFNSVASVVFSTSWKR